MDVCVYDWPLTYEHTALSIVALNCSTVGNSIARVLVPFATYVDAHYSAAVTELLGDGLLSVTLAVAEHKLAKLEGNRVRVGEHMFFEICNASREKYVYL
jgi:hypothetical protein